MRKICTKPSWTLKPHAYLVSGLLRTISVTGDIDTISNAISVAWPLSYFFQ